MSDEIQFRSELFTAMDGNLRPSRRKELLDAYREAVLSGTVEVKFDQSLHPSVRFDDLDEPSKLAFAGLDTAYNVLREYAVRVTFQSIRDEAAEQGQTMPPDEELFRLAKESGVEGAPTSYLDLAPAVQQAAMALHEAFEYLVAVATEEAIEGMFGGEDG